MSVPVSELYGINIAIKDSGTVPYPSGRLRLDYITAENIYFKLKVPIQNKSLNSGSNGWKKIKFIKGEGVAQIRLRIKHIDL